MPGVLPAGGPQRTLIVALLAFLALAPATPPGAATPLEPVVETLPAVLPEPLVALRGVQLDGQAYLLGGRSGIAHAPVGHVYEVDLSTGAVTDTGLRLPIPVDNAAVVVAFGLIYVFGGRGADGVIRAEVQRVDPAGHHAEVLTTTLPEPRWGMAAETLGEDIVYLMGGRRANNAYVSQILRFDPLAESVTATGHNLPRALGYATAVHVQDALYLFGGHAGGVTGPVDDIHRYDPLTGTVERLAAALPHDVYHVTAVVDADAVWLFGGVRQPFASIDSIGRFTPADGRLEVFTSVALPTPRHAMGALHAGDRILLFGGENGFEGTFADVLGFGAAHLPVPVIAPLPAMECLERGASVVLDGRDSHDPRGKTLLFAWSAPRGTIQDPTAAHTAAWFPYGTTEVTLTVHNGAHAVSTQADVVVVDTVAPGALSFDTPRQGNLYLDGQRMPHHSAAGIQVVGDIIVQASITDACGIEHVAFQSPQAGLRFDTGAPYTYPMVSDGIGTEEVVVAASARDLGGATRAQWVAFDWVHKRPL